MTQEPTDSKKSGTPSIARTFGVVAFLTVLSKFAGLIRDVLVAREYGTSVIADAYQYAYMFTGNILILVGGLGGPFHSATVAIVTPHREDRKSGILICQIMAITFVALSAITVVAYLVTPYICQLMAAKYEPNVLGTAHTPGGQAAIRAINELMLPANKLLYQQQMQAQLWIMLPLIVLSGLVGVSYGILNVYNKIFWPSLSPAIASLAIIVAIYWPSEWTTPGARLYIGLPLAIGTLAGAIGQFLAQLPGMLKLDLQWKLELTAQPELREYAKMLWPALFSTSIGQLTVYVDAYFALLVHTQGAWTAIVNSNRLVQLPLGILLTAMLVPILPRFTEQVSQNREDDLKDELRRALRFMWFLALPMTAILLALPSPIIQVLFQRGNFDQTSTQLVTIALEFLVPSIFFYVARDLMTRVFYAYKDSITPYRVAMLAIIVKAVLDYVFVVVLNWGIEGISLATTLITVFNLSLLTFALKRKIGNLGFSKLMPPLVVMLTATVACGAATIGVYWALVKALHASVEHPIGTLEHLVVIGIACIAGLLVYLIICLLFKLDEPMMFARRLPVVKRFVK